MSRNPLRQPRYVRSEFDRYNFFVKRSISEYDLIPKDYPKCLLDHRDPPSWPKATYNEDGEKICARENCGVLLAHVRSLLCEPHRRERYLSTKRGRQS